MNRSVIALTWLLLIAALCTSSEGLACCDSWQEYAAYCRSTGGNPVNNPPRCLPAAPSGATGSTPLQQIEMQGAQQLGTAIGNQIGQALFGSSQDPAQQQTQQAQHQRELVAQQLNNSGMYLFKQKNYAGAINEFQQALAQTPNDANILHNLQLAKQQLKDKFVAGQTSGALSQLLGSAPTVMGNSDSTLKLLNMGPGAGVKETQNAAEAPADPESLKGQLDVVLTNNAAASSPSHPQVVQPQAQAIDEIFRAPQAAPSASAALAHQAALGQMAVTAKADEDASGLAKQGFDTPAPTTLVSQARGTPAPSTATSSSISSDGIDVRQSKQSSIPRSLKTAQSTTDPGPVVATLRTPMLGVAGSGGAAAAGAPIFDCEGDHATIIRLASGFPAQEEAIRRTEAAIKAAKDDNADAREEAQLAAVKTLVSAATTISNWSEAAIARVEGPKAAGISADTAAKVKFLEHLKRLAEDSDNLIDATQLKKAATKSYEAGYTFGNAVLVQNRAKTLLDEIEATRRFLADSGIGEELAAKGALYGLGPINGPIGEALVHAVANGVDALVETVNAWNSAGEAAQAQRDLTVMRYQQMLVRDRMYEMQKEIAVGCSN